MFKRVAKKEQKRRKKETLGLDEEMKQVLGLQDTDSDESSDSNSDEPSDVYSYSGEETSDGDVDPTDHLHHKRKHPIQHSASLHSDGIPEELECSDDDDEDCSPMSVIAATTDPIYDLPNTPQTLDLRACIICPGKVIKNPTMAKIHPESSVLGKAHRRRLQRYTAEVSKRAASREGLNTDDPGDILRDMSGTGNYQSQVGTSKRSQRRAQWKDTLAERRKNREMRDKLAMGRSKKMDHQYRCDEGTIELKVKKAKNHGNVLGGSGLPVTVESSQCPKPADKQIKATRLSGPIKSNLDDNRHAPQKRQKRKAAIDTDTQVAY